MVILGAVLLVAVAMVTVWTIRYAWTIYRLNRGVGDTVFYDAAGKPWFRLDEQRRDVELEQISTYFKDAVIAVEDHRFYLHPGIDPIALARAVLFNLRSDTGVQGGSTLTQQLARTLFLSNTRTVGRKVKEAALAVLLEVFLSKREILQLYFDRVYLSAGIYGVETMSQKMLGKPAAKLTLGEAALIAGIIQQPSAFSPWTHFDAARRRSFVVLQRMREEGKITAAQERAARAETIRIRSSRSCRTRATATPRNTCASSSATSTAATIRLTGRCTRRSCPRSRMRRKRRCVTGCAGSADAGLQAALVALDPKTGNLLAMVGGSDFRQTPFNRAVRSKRQPGSAFKPFVYAVALERGMSPVSTITGIKQVAIQAPEGVWIPRDERVSEHDSMTLREALLESNNAAAVLLQQQVGSRPVLRLAADLGVPNQPDVPSLALGSGLVSPLELTAAYAVFPSYGYRVRPRGLVTVENATGDIVNQVHVEREQILHRACRLPDGDDATGRRDAGNRLGGAVARRARRDWRQDRHDQ